MDVNTPGREQWTIQSALEGHPAVTIDAHPQSHIEVAVVCQELNLGAIDIETFIAILREGEGKFESAFHGGGDIVVRRAENDPFVLIIDGPDGILNLHTLDVEGFAGQLLEAQAVASPPA